MSEIQLPYGRRSLTLHLPDDRPVEWVVPAAEPAASDPIPLIDHALDCPVGDVWLSDFAHVRSVAIAINDKTRPLPHPVLKTLLRRLEDMGIPPHAITLIFATGAHPVMVPEEFSQTLPNSILLRYPVLSHNCEDQANLVHLGETKRGTPVWANRDFMRADLRIVVGNIELHQFMGFAGGVKTAAIGLAGGETIKRNHKMMIDPRSQMGRYTDNPTRQDIEEIGRMMGIQFALNVILNREKQITQVFAGDPVAVMKAGIPQIIKMNEIEVAAPFDVMIVSPGGHPKDLNLYQAQKALAHAARITKDSGLVILVAACPEGTGGAAYEQWMEGMTTHQAVLERFKREEFRLGPHKAYQIARDAARVQVMLYSEMPAEQVKRWLLTPVDNIEDVIHKLPMKSRIGIMPAANVTLPVIAPNYSLTYE
jgi:nickel-dependent lactate racemase